ncbi:MAG: hypothetical protein LBL35_02830 [Clostridiales bacterium]|jgi:hypothetical protein|nr:hypothetical protein [Clostridiales bacterium]
MEIRPITDEEELKYFFRIRYKVFTENDENIPNALFPDGIWKDDEDDYAFHLGSYEGDSLLGAVSVVIRDTPENIDKKLHDIESDPFNLVCEKESAEIKILLLIDENIGNDIFIRGKAVEDLFNATNELLIAHNVKYAYLLALERTKDIYEKAGYVPIGEFNMYKGAFWTCPMKLTIKNGQLPKPILR